MSGMSCRWELIRGDCVRQGPRWSTVGNLSEGIDATQTQRWVPTQHRWLPTTYPCHLCPGFAVNPAGLGHLSGDPRTEVLWGLVAIEPMGDTSRAYPFCSGCTVSLYLSGWTLHVPGQTSPVSAPSVVGRLSGKGRRRETQALRSVNRACG